MSFAGCAVIISHDRWFLDRVCTHILAFEGDSQVYWFEGGYSEYEENKKKRLGNVEPRRVRYKKLTVQILVISNKGLVNSYQGLGISYK